MAATDNVFALALALCVAGLFAGPLVKKTDCGNVCATAFCVARQPEECDPRTEVFVAFDGDCYCCDSCVRRADGECQPDRCATASCRDVASKTCFDMGLAFAPRDECTCCDSCV